METINTLEEARAAQEEEKARIRRELERAFEYEKTVLPADYRPLPPVEIKRISTDDKDHQFYDDCKNGRLNAVEMYVSSNGSREKPDLLSHIHLGLENAVEGGHIETARYLISNGAQLSSRVLTSACQKPSLEIFKFFVEDLDWDPNQGKEDGTVVLPYCVADEQLLRYLLSQGADPNYGRFTFGHLRPECPTDRASGQAINAAARLCEPHIIDILLEHGARLEDATPVHSIVFAHPEQPDREAMLRHLLDMGCDINGDDYDQVRVRNHREGTPLSAATRWGRQKAAELLLEFGAAPQSAREKPDWYTKLIEQIKERKGEDVFWADVKARILPGSTITRPRNPMA